MKTLNVRQQFLNVGYCCSFCTQVPKQMWNGCSHPGRWRNSYRHWQSHPWLLMKREAILIFHVVLLPAPPSHLNFPQLLSSMKWWWGGEEQVFWKNLGQCWWVLIASLLHAHASKFPTAASGVHSQHSPYASRSMESTVLITMPEATAGQNCSANILPKSTDMSL